MNEDKKNKTSFKKGVSGNKKGRPKGAKNKKTLLAEAITQKSDEMLLEALPKVLEVVIEQAAEGNLVAAKMILDRGIPLKKAVDVNVRNTGELGVNIVVNQLEAPRRILEGECQTSAITSE